MHQGLRGSENAPVHQSRCGEAVCGGDLPELEGEDPVTTTPTEKPHVRVMSSITVSYPPKRPMAHCEFSVRCKKAKLDHRSKPVCIVSINGSGPHVEWGCVSCSRVVVLKHMARLSRFQGFLI